MWKVFPARDNDNRPRFLIGHTVTGATLPQDGPPELFEVEKVAQDACDALNSPCRKTAFMAFELFGKRGEIVDAPAVDHEADTPEPFPLIPPDLIHALSELVMLYGPDLVKLAAARY